jgi:hypothetical protein
MRWLGPNRVSLVLLCLAMLLAALLPAAHGLAVAVLAPFWFFVTVVLSFRVRIADKPSRPQLFPFLAVFSPRPPPVR